jgi:hypothetical protein
MPSRFDKEKTKKNIALIVEQIRNEADPELLNQYRALFKKEVSLFHRSYTAAYLLMLYDQGRLRGQGLRNRSPASAGRGEKSGRAPEEPRTERQYPLPDGESRRLFISIGRNRRVFPREILGLINSAAAVAKEDVGAIRILDNYSFVQVRSTLADTIIEALNGKPFRGRVLQVNYAHAKKDEGEDGYDGTDSVDTEKYGGDETLLSTGSLEQDDDHPDEESV